MKDPKFSRSTSRMWGLGVHSSRGLSNKGPCKVIGIIVFGMLMLVLLLGPGNLPDLSPAAETDELSEIRAYEKSLAVNSVSVVSHRNTSFSLGPKISDLDVRRKTWALANPNVRAGRPKVQLVTGSNPIPCERPIDTHMFLKAAKNKIHFCRMHDIQMYYSLLEPDRELVGSWAKLPLLRMLMLAHQEVEWFWWMDSDTVITDMHFELPVEKYQGYNFVIFGDDHRVLDLKDWNGLSTGNFLIRNCQWSLHLLDAWGSMGPLHSRAEVGEFLSSSLHGRPEGIEADDQSALVYLLSTETKLWAPKVYLEHNILFTGVWMEVTDKLEEMQQYGHGDPRFPVVTHFAGCSQCGGSPGEWPWEDCQREMERAMDFADDQVYRVYGYQFRKLGVPEIVPVPGHEMDAVVAAPEQPLGDFRGYPLHKLPGPIVEKWDAQRDAWFRANPGVTRTNEHGQPKTMIVTGSSSIECTHPMGGQNLLQALKNKVDYARYHDMEFFYGMVDFDLELVYWWTKIPTIRMLMLSHPDVEWFFWCDGDAVITDMTFNIPFEKFKGQNLVLYGDTELVKQHDWIGVNAGIYLIRNCQWTLDLLDVWGSMGSKENRVKAGTMTSDLLPGRTPGLPADDQSTLIYLLITDKEKAFSPYIRLEREFTMSGYWKMIGPRFEDMKLTSHPGSGSLDWPFITHFAGCQPCGTKKGNFDVEECRVQIRRSFDFADDQILESYGLKHSSLGNPEVQRIKTALSR